MRPTRLGTPIIAVRRDGTQIPGRLANLLSGGRVVLRRADGYCAVFMPDQVRRQDADYGEEFDAESYFQSEVKRVFAEFQQTIGRPPTLQEFRSWLPGAWAVPMMRKMGMEVSR